MGVAQIPRREVSLTAINGVIIYVNELANAALVFFLFILLLFLSLSLFHHYSRNKEKRRDCARGTRDHAK